jgi:hypothetical protein
MSKQFTLGGHKLHLQKLFLCASSMPEIAARSVVYYIFSGLKMWKISRKYGLHGEQLIYIYIYIYVRMTKKPNELFNLKCTKITTKNLTM